MSRHAVDSLLTKEGRNNTELWVEISSFGLKRLGLSFATKYSGKLRWSMLSKFSVTREEVESLCEFLDFNLIAGNPCQDIDVYLAYPNKFDLDVEHFMENIKDYAYLKGYKRAHTTSSIVLLLDELSNQDDAMAEFGLELIFTEKWREVLEYYENMTCVSQAIVDTVIDEKIEERGLWLDISGLGLKKLGPTFVSNFSEQLDWDVVSSFSVTEKQVESWSGYLKFDVIAGNLCQDHELYLTFPTRFDWDIVIGTRIEKGVEIPEDLAEEAIYRVDLSLLLKMNVQNGPQFFSRHDGELFERCVDLNDINVLVTKLNGISTYKFPKTIVKKYFQLISYTILMEKCDLDEFEVYAMCCREIKDMVFVKHFAENSSMFPDNVLYLMKDLFKRKSIMELLAKNPNAPKCVVCYSANHVCLRKSQCNHLACYSCWMNIERVAKGKNATTLCPICRRNLDLSSFIGKAYYQ